MIINSIDTKDISFVVQGAVDKLYTKPCLESIRSNFPGSTIILSTWKGTNVKGLDFDQAVFGEDPGGATYDHLGNCNNINRQIVSSYEGLKVVTTKYAAKVRNDLIFESPEFLSYFDTLTEYNEDLRKVSSRMITLSIYSRVFGDVYTPDWKKIAINNYSVSDWFYFGYTEDVRNYFSLPLISNVPEFSRYYLGRSVPYPWYFSQLSPEQYLCAAFRGLDTGKETRISLSSHKQLIDSIRFIVNNFIILDYDFSKIYSKKYEQVSKNPFSIPQTAVGLFFYGDFLRYYKRYCEPGYVIPNNIDKEILKKKLNAAKDFLWRDKVREYRHKFFTKLKERFSFVKKIFRWISPAYRVGYGTRDILLHMQEEERASLNYLHYKVDNLSKELEEKSKEIKKLNKQLAAIMKEDEDELC